MLSHPKIPVIQCIAKRVEASVFFRGPPRDCDQPLVLSLLHIWHIIGSDSMCRKTITWVNSQYLKEDATSRHFWAWFEWAWSDEHRSAGQKDKNAIQPRLSFWLICASKAHKIGIKTQKARWGQAPVCLKNGKVGIVLNNFQSSALLELQRILTAHHFQFCIPVVRLNILI